MSEQARPSSPAPVAYTWRTFACFFAIAIAVGVIVQLVLQLWLPGDIAAGVGTGVAVPILMSGNPRWREPRVLPWVILVVAATGVLGGLVAWWRR